MLIYYAIGFMMVAIVFNMANRNLAKKRNAASSRKNYKEALQEWEEFKQKHPGSDERK